MKKLIILLLAFLAASFTLFAQSSTDCDQLRSEVDYLRKALKMQSNPVYTDVVIGLELKILSIIGNRRSRTVEVLAMVTSQRRNRQGGFWDYQYAIDPEGNQYASDGPLVDLPADISRKIQTIFKDISPDIPFFKLMKLNFRSQGDAQDQQQVVEYRNVKIDWK